MRVLGSERESKNKGRKPDSSVTVSPSHCGGSWDTRTKNNTLYNTKYSAGKYTARLVRGLSM